MKSTQIRNSFLLFLAAFIWGVAFVSQSKGMEYMGPLTFNGTRSLLGTVVLIPLVMWRSKTHKNKKIIDKTAVIGGICCGLALTTASLLQQYGILYTTVGKAGFITTLYIIFVPILGIFLKRKVPTVVWLCAVLAALGMYLLCVSGDFTIGIGDSLVFICAIVFAIHILVIDYFAPKADGVVLSMIQFLICGLISLTGAFLFEDPSWPQITDGMIPILYAGIMSCGVAYTLQIIGQKGVNPTVAALILSMESVFSALAGYLAYKVGFLKTDQTLTLRQLLGCVIVFMAVIIVQLPIKKKENV